MLYKVNNVYIIRNYTLKYNIYYDSVYVFSSFSLLYFSNSRKNCALGFITFGLSPRHLGQYHFPFGFVVRVTQEKWNHSIGHRSLSHIIISPNEIWSHKQYVGSSGSIAASSSRGGDSSRCVLWFVCLDFLFFFLPVPITFILGLFTNISVRSKILYLYYFSSELSCY